MSESKQEMSSDEALAEKLARQVVAAVADHAKKRGARKKLLDAVRGRCLELLDQLNKPRFAMTSERLAWVEAVGGTAEEAAKQLPQEIDLSNGAHADRVGKVLLALAYNSFRTILTGSKMHLAIDPNVGGTGPDSGEELVAESDAGMAFAGKALAEELIEVKTAFPDSKTPTSYRISTNKTLGSCDAYFLVLWKPSIRGLKVTKGLEELLGHIHCVAFFDAAPLKGHKSTKTNMRFNTDKFTTDKPTRFNSKSHEPEALHMEVFCIAGQTTEDQVNDFRDKGTWQVIAGEIGDWFMEKRYAIAQGTKSAREP